MLRELVVFVRRLGESAYSSEFLCDQLDGTVRGRRPFKPLLQRLQVLLNLVMRSIDLLSQIQLRLLLACLVGHRLICSELLLFGLQDEQFVNLLRQLHFYNDCVLDHSRPSWLK